MLFKHNAVQFPYNYLKSFVNVIASSNIKVDMLIYTWIFVDRPYVIKVVVNSCIGIASEKKLSDR